MQKINITDVTGLSSTLVVATTSTSGFLSAADKTKLDGIAAGATANSSNATLLARANHTGEQAISTITGLQTALDGKQPTGSYALSSHVHSAATTSVDGFLSAADKTKLDGVATGATANYPDATLLARANHTGVQAIATVTGLQTALDNAVARANHTGTQAISTVTGLQTALDNAVARANHTGTQAISTVTGLQTALDAKANLAGATFTGAITGTSAAFSGSVTATGSQALLVKGGTADRSYVGFYPLAADQGTRSAILGFASAGNTQFSLINELAGNLSIVGEGVTISARNGTTVNLATSGAVQANGNTIWHAGNDGASSGLDADLLDGQQGSHYLAFANLTGKPTTLAGYGITDSVWHAGNDGAGSGLDADLLDGYDSSAFPRKDESAAITGNWTFNATPVSVATEGFRVAHDTGYYSWYNTAQNTRRGFLQHSGATMTLSNEVSNSHFNFAFVGTGELRSGGNKVWHAGNDGASSGLDADLLDGQHGSYYLDSTNLTGTIADARLPTTQSGKTFNSHTYVSGGNLFTVYDSATNNRVRLGADTGSGGGYVDSTFSSSGTADLSLRSAGVTRLKVTQSNTIAYSDILVTKSNPWLTLQGSGANPAVDEASGISIGETGYKGSAALHLTYTGDGYGHIGMGTVSGTTNLPAFEAIRLQYQSNVATFLATPTVNGNTMWHAGNDGAGSGLDADTVDGYTPVINKTANTIGLRDGNGRISFHGVDVVGAPDNHTDGSPWYGVGLTSVTTLSTGSAGNAVQAAGYYGLRLRSAHGYLDIHENSRAYYTGTSFQASGQLVSLGGFVDGVREDSASRPARILSPQGGYAPGTPTQVGAIKIRLPAAVANSNTMVRFTVKIFEYYTGGIKTFDVGGYNYNNTWVNVSANCTTDQAGNYNVRFGWDGVTQCVWIGEVGTSWSYPQVHITDVQCGYGGFSNSWASGWQISFVTSFDTTVSHTRSAAYTWNQNNDGAGSGLDADLLDGMNATSAATASTVMSRDSSGNTSVASITASSSVNSAYVVATYINANYTSTGVASRIAVEQSSDGYIRWKTPAQFFADHGVWNSSNDGSGSGLDADLLDGLHASSFLRSDAANTNVTVAAAAGNGVKFWGGGDSYAIWMSDQANATYGGRVGGDTVSDYNMYFRMSGTGRGFTFQNSTTNVAGIDGYGNFRCIADIVAYSSDRRLKTNITPIASPLDKLSRIGGYTFDWDRKLTEELGFTPYQYEDEHGFIAQEIEAVVPDAVRPAPFNDEYLTVKYERIVPLAVAGINELAAKNAALEAKVADLESKLNRILAMLEDQEV